MQPMQVFGARVSWMDNDSGLLSAQSYYKPSRACVKYVPSQSPGHSPVGPFSAIWYIYQEWAVPPPGAQCPFWILALGGVGIVLGLATYGYR